MPVRFNYQNVPFRISESGRVKRWIYSVLDNSLKQHGDIRVIFTDSYSLLQINREFLEHDYHTDVITFDYTEGNIVTGEVYIGIETVKDNAVEFNTTFRREVLRVLVHGILHLAGFDDRTEREKKEMRKLEDIYLDKFFSGEF